MKEISKNRVLLICYGRPFGGAETYTGRIAQLLQNDIECLALSGTSELTSYLRNLGMQVMYYRPLFKDGRLWYLEFLFVAFCLLPVLRLKGRIDAIWIQGFREAFILPWAWLLGCRIIATMHVTLGKRFSQTFYPYMLTFSHVVICVSRTVAESLPFFVARHKVFVINNWASDIQTQTRLRVGGGSLRLLYVGRLVDYKGASVLIEAYRVLSERHPNKLLSLEIVGDGCDRRNLEKQAEGLSVVFSGFQSDPSEAYRTSDVFINPTYGPEGSSLVALEAMSHGLPVILSDIQVNQELSGGGRYAKLFQRGNVEDLVARLEEFLTSSHELETFSQRSFEAIRDKFSPEIACEEYRRALSVRSRKLVAQEGIS